MTFKLDAGAEVTESTLTKLGNAKLSPVTKSLCGPDRKPLEVTGRVKATLYSKNHKCDHEVYVIKEQKHNLLGLLAIKKELQLLKQIDHLSLITAPLSTNIQKLFSGLGKFTRNHHQTRSKTVYNLYTPQGSTTTSSESAE